MNKDERDAMNAQRRVDVDLALAHGWGLADLAEHWRVSRPSVTQWCHAHIDRDTHRKLSENGRIKGDQNRRGFHLAHRLELIRLCKANGWSTDKIGLALGCAYTAVWHLIERHAPDGIDAALEDFREEDEAA